MQELIGQRLGQYQIVEMIGQGGMAAVFKAWPPGLVEPKRGFGWLWRTHLGGADGPLGWALDREYGFDNVGQAQPFEQGVMFKGSAPKVYVLLNNGQFYAR